MGGEKSDRTKFARLYEVHEGATAEAAEELLVGASAEVAGCNETCLIGCEECSWEECTVEAVHVGTYDVRISSDGEVCNGVRRHHVRLPRAAEGGGAEGGGGQLNATIPSCSTNHLALVELSPSLRTEGVSTKHSLAE